MPDNKDFLPQPTQLHKPDTDRVAVIDLGTNTFHILIAETSVIEAFKVIYQDTVAVKLGEGGINQGIIQPVPYQRGLDALQSFQQQIKKFGVSRVMAIGTSAIRSAANGQQFTDEVKALTGIHIETINGDSEAGYIYDGIKASGCLQNSNSLIVDIGGGSVEFIIGNAQGIAWKQSFEIGAARLMNLFHQTDPIPQQSLNELKTYLDKQLTDLFTAVTQYPIDYLIGSSGAFETFAALVETAKQQTFAIKNHKTYQFNAAQLVEILSTLIQSSHDERKHNPAIIPVRVDMIVAAAALTNYLIKKLDLQKVLMSAYSLKEGAVYRLLSQA